MITIARNSIPQPSPPAMIYGPKVCLMNEFSASDGDLFPYRFRQYKLGKLIGKRSWGGVVGIRGSLPFVDGGTAEAGVLALRRRRQEVDHRGPRRRSRHRRGQRPGTGIRGHRRATQQGHRGDPRRS